MKILYPSRLGTGSIKWGGKQEKQASSAGSRTRGKGGLSMQKVHANISYDEAARKGEYRDRIEVLKNRVSLLAGKDKVLMTMYLENGNSFYQMAQLAGVSESTIARRIHKLTRRLIDGKYMVCLRNREKFTKREMDIATDYFLKGLSMKKIATKRRWSYYRVYESMKKIQGFVGSVENVTK
jgi:predicted DNA-binding protein YlxM (UPF0122 family)